MIDFDISTLVKAKKLFDDFRQHLDRKQDQAGAIQSYEYTYELSWKYMKKILAKRGMEAGSPRQVIRKAHEEGLISNIENWFTFIEMRNLTTHTYNEDNMHKVLASFDLFSAEVDALIAELQKNHA